MLTPKIQQQYQWLTESVGVVDLRGRTLLELTGADRAVLLHNLCTADVKRLRPEEGCEAFLTDASGKILAYVLLFAEPERIVLETIAGQGEHLAAHLDRYIFREDVQVTDRTSDWHEWLIAGPQAAPLLQAEFEQKLPETALAHLAGSLRGVPVSLRRVNWTTATGYLIQSAAEQAEQVGKILADLAQKAGGGVCSEQAFEIARVEAGMPIYGQDISHENLPQEIDRDKQAISFTKGCYLGQETIARIDALGHVNWLLRQVRFEGETAPPPGTELTTNGKKTLRVTSSVYSPKFAGPLALAFVRRGHEKPGTKLKSEFGEVEVLGRPPEP